MNSYVKKLIELSDEQIVEQPASPLPGSQNHELIKFELQRRTMIAQKKSADATLRGAIAAERYTKATWILILVTVISLTIALLK
jgi:hypothetical protein